MRVRIPLLIRLSNGAANPLDAEGRPPFRVQGAETRKPNAGPWIVSDADGLNAIRFSDGIRAFFEDAKSARVIAERLNLQGAAA